MTPDKLRFWAGNGVLAVAMLILFFMKPLSDAFGFAVVILWMILAALGVWLVMTSKEPDQPPLE